MVLRKESPQDAPILTVAPSDPTGHSALLLSMGHRLYLRMLTVGPRRARSCAVSRIDLIEDKVEVPTDRGK
ncbi:unannotated protein [freshwater metagenome]|uniref:Unannotated protein n=1 Tax=freshwater metagenome TaxID=449393 RepID=A0A6J6YLW0_9ZZZZ